MASTILALPACTATVVMVVVGASCSPTSEKPTSMETSLTPASRCWTPPLTTAGPSTTGPSAVLGLRLIAYRRSAVPTGGVQLVPTARGMMQHFRLRFSVSVRSLARPPRARASELPRRLVRMESAEHGTTVTRLILRADTKRRRHGPRSPSNCCSSTPVGSAAQSANLPFPLILTPSAATVNSPIPSRIYRCRRRAGP